MKNYTKKNNEYERTRFNDLKDIAELLRMEYRTKVRNMSLHFALRTFDLDYILFQELHSVPITQFTYNNINSSISIDSSWDSGGNLKYIIPPKGFNIKVSKAPRFMDLDELPTEINEIGFNHFIDKRGDYPKKWMTERLKSFDKIHTNSCVRIENINRVYFYTEYFEIFSDNIAIMGICADFYSAKNNLKGECFVQAPNGNNVDDHFIILNEDRRINKPDTYMAYYHHPMFDTAEPFADPVDEELRTGERKIAVVPIGQSYRKIDLED